MQLKEINRDKIVERKKRVEKHKKAIESDIPNSNMLSKDVATQEKAANDSDVIKKKTKKRIIDKKTMKEKQKAVSEKVMEDARKEKIDLEDYALEKEPEEPKVVITKEERAERFKRLNAMVQDMMKKQNE
jgi:hypothetical protein